MPFYQSKQSYIFSHQKVMCRQFLAVVLATLSLITLVQSVWYDNDTCSTPVSCDCKYIDQNLEEFCKDAENWGEMSGCGKHISHSALTIFQNKKP